MHRLLRSFIGSFSDSWRWVQNMELFIVKLNWTFKLCNLFHFKVHFFKRVRKISKIEYRFHYVCLSVCLCPLAWNNSATTGRNFMKFDIWLFLENLSLVLKFHYNLTRRSGIALIEYCTDRVLHWSGTALVGYSTDRVLHLSGTALIGYSTDQVLHSRTCVQLS